MATPAWDRGYGDSNGVVSLRVFGIGKVVDGYWMLAMAVATFVTFVMSAESPYSKHVEYSTRIVVEEWCTAVRCDSHWG